MSEVKSAREIADKIYDECYEPDSHDCMECGWGQSNLDTNKMIDIITSDRRAIIEKCKEAVDNVYAFGEDGRQCKHEALDALDSVLSEIEKEE